ncbi:hypothetical protein [Pseudarthrobacter sp. BRE9]|uniref:hypothetical protein n=1 Tax=Pseudarthrobacter sp. BRE9 TaxID=2962582 RepID=UPI002881A3BB|nr:hypothetical protein [Pseudarthrobacter sp. BRE9]MDT0169661.1 hypothetical protein [Pseudarthrobacter sp. BRE9]
MARLSSPWRAMRPALLAGAAAITWLTLSSTAASADSGPDSSSLLGSVTSSVSSLSNTVAPAPPASPAGAAAGPGLVQPVVTQVSGLADNIISAVPVVDQVVPSGTISVVAAPLAAVADGVTAGVAQVVAAPAAEAVPVLEPVLQPVADLLTGTVPLPLPLPASPVDGVPADLPAGVIPDSAAAQPAAVEVLPDAPKMAPEQDLATGSSPAGPLAGSNSESETAGAVFLADTSGPRTAVSVPADPAYDQPLPVDPSPLPVQAPAAPASGAGSGGSSGGPSGAAAWLSPFGFGFERPGAVLAGEASEHAPAPVSFDPGSSPD